VHTNGLRVYLLRHVRNHRRSPDIRKESTAAFERLLKTFIFLSANALRSIKIFDDDLLYEMTFCIVGQHVIYRQNF